MARPLRISYENAIYHITSRGNAKQNIFLSTIDKKYFLSVILNKIVNRYQWMCHSYCLMNNHYHLLIETPLANISQGMRQLNGVYTQHFNRIHDRVGHLFQGRFKAIIVEKDSHLLELCRYIVLNPVRAGICSTPEKYKWSSYGALIGTEKCPPFLTVNWILSQFAQSKQKAVKYLIEFMRNGLGDRPWERLKGQIYYGDKEFIAEMEKKNITFKEIPRTQRQPLRPSLPEILKHPSGIMTAYENYGYHLKEIAENLGVHYSTVSRRLKQLEKKEEMLYCKT